GLVHGREQRVRAQRDRVRVGLAQVPGHVGQLVRDAGGVQLHLVVDGAVPVGDLAGEVPFVERPLAAVGGVERVRRRQVAGGQPGDEAGVRAAAGDRAHGGVGLRQPRDLGGERLAYVAVRGAAGRAGAAVDEPEAAAAGAQGGGGAGQDAYAVDQRLLAEGGLRGEVRVESWLPQGGTLRQQREQRGDLRGERQLPLGGRPSVVQGLH